MANIPDKKEEQKDAEAEVDSFRKHLGPFVVATEVTRMAMVFTDAKDPAHPLVFANDSFLKLTGYEREEVLGRPFNSLFASGVAPATLVILQSAFDGTSDVEPEIHYRRKDGSEFWVSVFISQVRDENGVVVQHFISLVDLTHYKQEQTQSKMLIAELNHRVKIRLPRCNPSPHKRYEVHPIPQLSAKHRVSAFCARLLARPSDPRELGGGGAIRSHHRSDEAVRGLERSRWAPPHHG